MSSQAKAASSVSNYPIRCCYVAVIRSLQPTLTLAELDSQSYFPILPWILSLTITPGRIMTRFSGLSHLCATTPIVIPLLHMAFLPLPD
jgi:hypothetical protein